MLNFLSIGMTYADLQHPFFCVHRNTLSKFILQVCQAIHRMYINNVYFFF